MKKKSLIAIMLMFILILSLSLVGCNENIDKPKVLSSIEFTVQDMSNVKEGEFSVPYVIDNSKYGDSLSIRIIVTNEGQSVLVTAGKFLVEKNNTYIVTIVATATGYLTGTRAFKVEAISDEMITITMDLVYNPNGQSIVYKQFYKGISQGEIVEEVVPTRIGYEFLGWFASEDSVEPIASELKYITDAKLFARWKTIFDIVEVVGEDGVSIDKYYGLDDHVVIPDKIDGKQVIGIEAYAFNDILADIVSVELPFGIKSIGEHAFSTNPNLTEINVPFGVEIIGLGAFTNCPYITIKCQVAEAQTGWREDFADPKNVEYQADNISSGDYDYVVWNNQAYITKYKGGEIAELSNEIDEYFVSTYFNVFINNTNITKVIVEGIQELESGLFEGCDNIQYIVLPDNTNTILDGILPNNDIVELYIGANTANCDDGWNMAGDREVSVEWNFEDIYKDAEGREYILYNTLKGASFEAKYYKNYFENTGDIIIESNFTYNNKNYVVVELETGLFSGCSDIISLTIPTSVELVGGYLAMNNLNVEFRLEASEVPISWDINWNKNSHSTTGTVITSYQNSEVIEGIKYIIYQDNTAKIIGYTEDLPANVIIPNMIKGSTEVIEIGNKAFANNINMESLVMGENIAIIGSESFADCIKLISVVFKPNIVDIGESVFEGCTALANINFDEANSLLSLPNYMFKDCISLVELVISNSIVDVGIGAFMGCVNLTDITLSTALEVIGKQAFADNNSLKTITIPNTVTRIEEEAFAYLNQLSSVIISNFSKLQSIDYRAFYNCFTLTEINLPATFVELGESAFEGCQAMTKVAIDVASGLEVIPNSAFKNNILLQEFKMPIQLKSIEAEAFSGCISINNIIITPNITTIGSGAFADCENLWSVNFDNANVLTQIGREAFKGCYSITTMVLPTLLEIIEPYTFAGLTTLETITIGDNLTTIQEGAFSDCARLQVVDLRDNIELIESNAFAGCQELIALCGAEVKPEAWSSTWIANANAVEWNYETHIDIEQVRYLLYKDKQVKVLSILSYIHNQTIQLLESIQYEDITYIVRSLADGIIGFDMTDEEIITINVRGTVPILQLQALANVSPHSKINYENPCVDLEYYETVFGEELFLKIKFSVPM